MKSITFLGDPMRTRTFAGMALNMMEVVSFTFTATGVAVGLSDDVKPEFVEKLDALWRSYVELVPGLGVYPLPKVQPDLNVDREEADCEDGTCDTGTCPCDDCVAKRSPADGALGWLERLIA